MANIYISGASISPNPVRVGQQIIITCTIDDVTWLLATDSAGTALADSDGKPLQVGKGSN